MSDRRNRRHHGLIMVTGNRGMWSPGTYRALVVRPTALSVTALAERAGPPVRRSAGPLEPMLTLACPRVTGPDDMAAIDAADAEPGSVVVHDPRRAG